MPILIPDLESRESLRHFRAGDPGDIVVLHYKDGTWVWFDATSGASTLKSTWKKNSGAAFDKEIERPIADHIARRESRMIPFS